MNIQQIMVQREIINVLNTIKEASQSGKKELYYELPENPITELWVYNILGEKGYKITENHGNDNYRGCIRISLY